MKAVKRNAVAQIVNLPRRRLAIGVAWRIRKRVAETPVSGLTVRDTADYQSQCALDALKYERKIK